MRKVRFRLSQTGPFLFIMQNLNLTNVVAVICSTLDINEKRKTIMQNATLAFLFPDLPILHHAGCRPLYQQYRVSLYLWLAKSDDDLMFCQTGVRLTSHDPVPVNHPPKRSCYCREQESRQANNGRIWPPLNDIRRTHGLPRCTSYHPVNRHVQALRVED